MKNITLIVIFIIFNTNNSFGMINFNDCQSMLNALNLAIQKKNIDTIKLLIENTAYDDNQLNEIFLNAYHLAVSNNDLGLIKTIIKKVDINSTDPNGKSLLHIALNKGNFDIVKLLCKDKSIDIEKKDAHGWTPLYKAILLDDKIAKLLLKKQANINSTNTSTDETPLHHACSTITEPNIQILKLLLNNKKITIDPIDQLGDTPLHKAIQLGHTEAIKILIQHNANVNAININNNHLSALSYAILNFSRIFIPVDKTMAVNWCPKKDTDKPSLEIIDLLIENGANLGHIDKFNRTPLNHSLNFDFKEPINRLLEVTPYKCLMKKNTRNKNILHLSIEKNDYDITKNILKKIKYTKDLLDLDDNYKNSLNYACEKNSSLAELIIKKLLDLKNPQTTEGKVLLLSDIQTRIKRYEKERFSVKMQILWDTKHFTENTYNKLKENLS